VWLALTFDQHAHHSAARAWFESLTDGDACAFCRLTQQGFLRLATYRKIFGDDTLSMADAWGAFDQLLADPRVSLISEPVGVETRWRAYTTQQPSSSQVWSDAWLAAIAVVAQLQLVSFDRDFLRYRGLNRYILT